MKQHINATRAVLSLHCKSGDICPECATPYPCLTVKTVMDSMSGSVTDWFE